MPTKPLKQYTTVLTIAGSDGSGGAGIQADLKTFAALGCYGLSVVTDITAQNTCGVSDSFALPAEFVARQIRVLADDIHIDAIKIGMVSSPETIRAIAETLRNTMDAPLVLDTVLASSSGTPLSSGDSKKALLEELLPLADLVTPNIPEAADLTGTSPLPSRKTDIERMADILRKKGASAVLIKGGHTTGQSCDDYLLSSTFGEWLSGPKIETPNTHGTGCTLSSAIAAGLAKGLGLLQAVKNAKEFTSEALRSGAGFSLGKGAGPLHHLYALPGEESPLGKRPIE